MDWSKLDDFVERNYRRSHSIHSERFYRYGVTKFKDFCEEQNLNVNHKNVYDVLDAFVASLDRKGVKPKTAHDYVSAVKKYLAFVDIKVDSSLFRAKVVMPKVSTIADQPLTIEQVRTVLTKGRPNPKMRTLILMLLSSGMRIGEALSLKVKDLALDSSPATVSVRAEYSKTRVGRTGYLSDEAKEALREIVKDAPGDRLVIEYSGNLWEREKLAVRTFREVVERAGLGEKIEDHRIHRIHFHSFRKFFLTKAVDLLGDHAGHALCGHGFYMDTYYKKSEEERAQDYLRLMPQLSVFGREQVPDMDTVKREAALEAMRAVATSFVSTR